MPGADVMSSRRKALFTVILIVLDAAVLLHLGLAVKRSICGPPSRYTLATAEYRFRVSLNGHGYRDDEFVKQKPEGNLRMLLIGDSYVFGVSDKAEVIDVQLEGLLSEGTGQACEVFSLGLPGLGFPEYWRIFKQFVGYGPDAITLLLYIDNDISQGAGDPHPEPGPFCAAAFQPRPEDMDDLDDLRPKLEVLVKEGKLAPDIGRLMMRGKLNPYLHELADRGPMDAHYDGLPAAFENNAEMQSTILAMAKEAKRVGASFVLCLAPGKYQVRKFEGWEVLKKLCVQWDDAVLQNRKIQDAILRFCAEHEVECVDTLPAMKKCPARCYYKIDDHLNAAGNRVVAETLARHLLTQGSLRQTTAGHRDRQLKASHARLPSVY